MAKSSLYEKHAVLLKFSKLKRNNHTISSLPFYKHSQTQNISNNQSVKHNAPVSNQSVYTSSVF